MYCRPSRFWTLTNQRLKKANSYPFSPDGGEGEVPHGASLLKTDHMTPPPGERTEPSYRLASQPARVGLGSLVRANKRATAQTPILVTSVVATSVAVTVATIPVVVVSSTTEVSTTGSTTTASHPVEHLNHPPQATTTRIRFLLHALVLLL